MYNLFKKLFVIAENLGCFELKIIPSQNTVLAIKPFKQDLYFVTDPWFTYFSKYNALYKNMARPKGRTNKQ